MPDNTFDLDAFIAEAEHEPFRFTFDGETYEMPADIDMRAVGAMAAGRIEEALQMLLGPEQWERLQASEATFGIKALSAVFDRYAAHAGVDMGNSSASTDSLPSTGRPSKRTSSGSTKSRSRTSPRAV